MSWSIGQFLRSTVTARRAFVVAAWIAVGGSMTSSADTKHKPKKPTGTEPAASAAGAAGASSQDFKISATVDLVVLDVSVKDHDGGFVSGSIRTALKSTKTVRSRIFPSSRIRMCR